MDSIDKKFEQYLKMELEMDRKFEAKLEQVSARLTELCSELLAHQPIDGSSWESISICEELVGSNTFYSEL